MPTIQRRQILDSAQLAACLERMAQEIISQAPDPRSLMLIGIQRRGVELAARLARIIASRQGAEPPRGALDITLYRDDVDSAGPKPLVGPTHLPGDIDGRHVWIVDDVLFTGRTVRAALDELADFGRPARVGLAVLVDRGHRELPIHADVMGLRLETARDDRVHVLVSELDGRDGVELAAAEDS